MLIFDSTRLSQIFLFLNISWIFGILMLFKYFLPADPEPVYLIQDRNSVLMVDKINFKNFIEDYAQTCPQYFEGLQVGQNINEELSLFISNYNQNCVYE